MVIEKFPPQEDEPAPKKPDFIYIEDVEVQDVRGQQQQQEPKRDALYESFVHMENSKYPNVIRVFTLLAAAGFFLFSFLALAFVAFHLALAVLTLFQSDEVNKALKKSWSGYNTLLVFTLGCLIATFSPAFGFGVILVYFAVKGKKLENSLLGRIFQSKVSERF